MNLKVDMEVYLFFFLFLYGRGETFLSFSLFFEQ